MPATVQAGDLRDLVTTTLSELGRMKMTDMMSDYLNTMVLSRVIAPTKTTKSTGKSISFNAITGTNESAKMVGMYNVDNISGKDVMTTGDVPWRHATWNYMFDQREPVMNAEPAKIVDLVKTRRYGALGSGIELMEQKLWRCPASSNVLDPYGLQYWIVKSATDAATDTARNGFNGGVPASGYTTVGGISPTTYRRWNNYADAYTAIAKDDLVAKMRRAAHYTNFKKLVEEVPDYNRGQDIMICTNYDVVAQMENMLQAQNEDLGPDIAYGDGEVVFKRHPVMPVFELDKDTSDPVYGIDFGTFTTEVLKGWWMKEKTLTDVPGQSTVTAVITHCSFNLMCRDRRKNWVISTSTTNLPA